MLDVNASQIAFDEQRIADGPYHFRSLWPALLLARVNDIDVLGGDGLVIGLLVQTRFRIRFGLLKLVPHPYIADLQLHVDEYDDAVEDDVSNHQAEGQGAVITHSAHQGVEAHPHDPILRAVLVEGRGDNHPVHEDRDQFDNPFLKHCGWWVRASMRFG